MIAKSVGEHPSGQRPSGRRHNDLLDSLPASDLARLDASLQWVSMRLGDFLYEPGAPLQHAYFPSTAVVSLHHVTASGACAQTCSVGHEGIVGMPLFLGGQTTPSAAMVHTGGHGWRLDRHSLLQEFALGGALQGVLLRHTQAMMVQIAQTVACYRHHSVQQQLAGWLLATLDRMPPEDELVMTQELLSSLLGVRRESITQAAGHLQQGGYIRYRRGHISVLDAQGLRSHTCECYSVVRAEHKRLAPANA